MKHIFLTMSVAMFAACGPAEEFESKPWSGAKFGNRCFPEEIGEVRCEFENPIDVHTSISYGEEFNPGGWVELQCSQVNVNWPDYHAWLKTRRPCNP